MSGPSVIPASEPHPKPAVVFISPTVVATERCIRIIDIRGRQERTSGIGYIPGSRTFPADLLRADMALLSDAYPTDTPMAIVCQSGRRAEDLWPELQAAGFTHTAVMTGGILGWRAAGLPTCGVEPPDPRSVPAVPDLAHFPRALSACFLATTVVYSESNPMWDGQDPVQTVQRIITEEEHGARSVSRAAIERAMERLSEMARLRGFPLEQIRANLDLMTEALRKITR